MRRNVVICVFYQLKDVTFTFSKLYCNFLSPTTYEKYPYSTTFGDIKNIKNSFNISEKQVEMLIPQKEKIIQN